ncbi:hypothetical protein MCEMHM7_01069 [Candidatus Methylopumilus planktonicus]|uniref:hypothetical protein n=1 Tax=Candidatus Methylopumilus planktonicus TaxID=1581557 RepID=UPI003BEED1C9
MKFADKQKRNIENFKEILPLIRKLLVKVHLSNKPQKYHFNNVDFLIRLNGDIIEIATLDEAPIFPTLAYRELSHLKADLLYYRVGSDFKSKLNAAIS